MLGIGQTDARKIRLHDLADTGGYGFQKITDLEIRDGIRGQVKEQLQPILLGA
jgi:hypothetical protein